jgi:hypothetical protein
MSRSICGISRIAPRYTSQPLLLTLACRFRFYSTGPSSKSHINDEILQLVPHKGKVSVIAPDGTFSSNVPLKKFLARQLNPKNQKLVVVKFSENVEADEADPSVVCKVIPLLDAGCKSPVGREVKPKTKRAKPAAVKDIPLSWNIALSDLMGQKKLAIKSVLTRGHTLQLQLDRKPGTRYPRELSELEIEKRKLLIEKCRELCLEWGEQAQKPHGSIHSRMTLVYAPRKS